MTDAAQYMALHGATLVDNGYAIIPIAPGTKHPGRYVGDQWAPFSGWQRMARGVTDFHIGLWSQWPGAGIGIICGNVIAIDIDILDTDVARAVTACILDELGGDPPIRVGRHPKCLLVYRTEVPFSKISKHPIEVLASGQQFVAFATHPDTNQPYRWVDATPVDIPLDRLPVVTETQVRAAVDKAFELVPEEMRPKRLKGESAGSEPHHSGDQEGTPEAVSEAAQAIPNEDLPWDDWNRVGMAIWAASGGRDFDSFDRFSQRSAKYDPKETRKRWDSYRRSPPTQIGMGTLVHLAMEAGWTPEPELPFNEAKREVTEVDLSPLLARFAPAAVPVVEPTPEERQVAARVVPPKELQADFPSEWFTTTSLVGEITRWIIRTARDPQPTFALANTLAMLGTIYGRRYRTAKERTHTNVMLVGIGPTGCGKEHSRGLCKDLLKAIGCSAMIAGDGVKSGAALVNLLGEYPSRLLSIDEYGMYIENVSNKKASSYQREIGSLLLRFFSAAGKDFHGEEYADRKNNPRVDIIAPNLNVFGTTTAETLTPALNKGTATSGTLSRVLFMPAFVPYPKRNWDHDPPDLPSDIVRELKASAQLKPVGAGNMAGEQAVPGTAPAYIEVTWDDAVERMLREIGDREQDFKAGPNGALWVRLREYTIKLAMIEAISRDAAKPVLTPDVVTMAYALVSWCLRYTEMLMRTEVAENETEARWKRVLKIIREIGPGGISKTKLAAETKDLTTRERDDVLKSLLDAEKIEERKVPAPGGRGRPTVVYTATEDKQ